MDRIKLTEPGSNVTFTVKAVEEVRTGKWPDYDFHATDGRVIVMPKTAADRQFARMKETPESVIGATVCVSRSDTPGDNGKLFWNLTLAAPAAATAAPSKRVDSPYRPAPARETTVPPRQPAGHGGAHIPEMDEPDPRDFPGHDPAAPAPWEAVPEPPLTPREFAAGEARTRREADYLALWDRVAAHLAKTCAAHRIALDASAVQAATFSIFNQR